LQNQSPQPGLNRVLVIGNVAFDVLCYPVEDVPRFRSMTFDQYEISPGGCGSNTAIGLAALDIPTALIASIGDDLAGDLAVSTWQSYGVNTDFIKKSSQVKTGVSVGLVDRNGQPRFVHTSGANALLTTQDCERIEILTSGDVIHIAGYFLLPGLMGDDFANFLEKRHEKKILVTMDVAQTPRMDNPDPLWKCLPYVDFFFCNGLEAELLTGKQNPELSARKLLDHSAKNVIIKLGADGCLLVNQTGEWRIPGLPVPVIDTTGAGDAFAAGFISNYMKTSNMMSACQKANQIGARTVSRLGALAAWM
jgi:sugar/nucleoside kinase (ribokinase family)